MDARFERDDAVAADPLEDDAVGGDPSAAGGGAVSGAEAGDVVSDDSVAAVGAAVLDRPARK